MRDYSSFGAPTGRFSVGVGASRATVSRSYSGAQPVARYSSSTHSLPPTQPTEEAPKKHDRDDICRADSEDDEAENISCSGASHESDESPPKRHRVWKTPTKRYSTAMIRSVPSSCSSRVGTYGLSSMTSIAQSNSESSSEDDENNSQSGPTDVASLRSKLKNFGEEQRQHFAKVNARPEPSSLTKPTRKLVSGSKPKSNGPTPLPPPAAQVLQRRLSHGNTAPLPMVRTKQPKKASSVVQATNEGYASVASLSAWLADDPTRTRRPKVLRRGANVITKSRTYDKGLTNVIVQETYLRSGHVTDKARNIGEQSVAGSVDACGDALSEIGVGSVASCSGRSSSNSSLESGNVSDKKEWLASAFKKDESQASESDSEENVSASRAKEMWRTRTQRHGHVPTPSSSVPRRRSSISAKYSVSRGAPHMDARRRLSTSSSCGSGYGPPLLPSHSINEYYSDEEESQYEVEDRRESSKSIPVDGARSLHRHKRSSQG